MKLRELWPIGLATLLIIFLPEKNLWMGDGYTVRAVFRDFNLAHVIALPDGWFFAEPITILGGMVIGWEGLSYLSGVIYLAGVAYLSIRHGSKFSILALLPIVQIFAGYYEVYPPVYAISLWALIAHLEDRHELLGVLALAAMFSHCVIAAPIVLLSAADQIRRGNRLEGGLIICALGVYALFMGTSFARQGILFSLTGFYSLFSPYHLMEIGGLVLASYGWVPLSGKSQPEDKLLIGASILALGMTFLFVPQLGMLRDWDLFSMATLLVAFTWLTGIRNLRWPSYAVAAGVLCGWMIFNSQPHLDLMARYLRLVPTHQEQYRDGYYKRVAQFIFVKEEGRIDLARSLDGSK